MDSINRLNLILVLQSTWGIFVIKSYYLCAKNASHSRVSTRVTGLSIVDNKLPKYISAILRRHLQISVYADNAVANLPHV
jgi:hypothetical protein